jgi:hypothetical protein
VRGDEFLKSLVDGIVADLLTESTRRRAKPYRKGEIPITLPRGARSLFPRLESGHDLVGGRGEGARGFRECASLPHTLCPRPLLCGAVTTRLSLLRRNATGWRR